MMEPVQSEEDAAKALNVSVRTLQRWRVEGRGPAFVKLGKRVGYLESRLRAYVESCVRQSTSSPGGLT
jgi:predicted site-specific integrase-resolvase